MADKYFHKDKFNIAWISMLVIFLGTIIYPISYEHARRESMSRTPIISVVTKEPSIPNELNVTPVTYGVPIPETVVTAETPEIPFVPFTRNLKKGDRGEDVKRLQEYLNSHGFIIAESGVGSPGHETELFGLNTEKALKKFQEANAEILLTPFGLTSGTGFFGEATRALINS